jgi:adenine specific DNA methylase Mod
MAAADFRGGELGRQRPGMPTRAELIWDGKYDAKGNRVAPLRVALPFQTVETINESAQERHRNLFQRLEQEQPWRNRLIWGDKKYVLPSLLPEFAGKVNLIYIDPPFDTGADFSFTASVPDAEDNGDDRIAFTKEPSLIEQKAYRDTWGRGLDSYLQWFYETVVLLHELLAENGSIYVHLDWHVGTHAKVVLDEVFGKDQCQNEIVWKRAVAKALTSRQLPNNHDMIFFYDKGNDATWNVDSLFHPYDETSLDEKTAIKYCHRDPDGRLYRLDNLINPNPDRPNLTYEFLGVTKVWRWKKERMQEAYQAGLVVQTKPGAVPQLKRYLDE